MKKDKHFSFRCTEDDWDYVVQLADADDRTPSYVLNQMIKKYREQSIKKDATPREGKTYKGVHRKMTKEEFGEGLMFYRACCGKEPELAHVEVWWEMLQYMPIDHFVGAV